MYGELSDLSGSQIYVREESRLAGVAFRQLAYAFAEGVLLGAVRPQGDGFQALLNPADDLRLETGDRIAVLAPSYKQAAPPQSLGAEVELVERPAPKHAVRAQRRMLILGWNHRVPALLHEFASTWFFWQASGSSRAPSPTRAPSWVICCSAS